jgi:hypothetical protein
MKKLKSSFIFVVAFFCWPAISHGSKHEEQRIEALEAKLAEVIAKSSAALGDIQKSFLEYKMREGKPYSERAEYDQEIGNILRTLANELKDAEYILPEKGRRGGANPSTMYKRGDVELLKGDGNISDAELEDL